MRLHMKVVPSVADKTKISYQLNDSWTILIGTFPNICPLSMSCTWNWYHTMKYLLSGCDNSLSLLPESNSAWVWAGILALWSWKYWSTLQYLSCSTRCHKQMYLTYWPLRCLCTWVQSALTLFWRSGWAPAASILSTTWRWPQNEAHIKAETPLCSGNCQTEQLCLQHWSKKCNVVYKELKQCKMLHQILHTLSLHVLLIPLIMRLLFISDLEGIREMMFQI